MKLFLTKHRIKCVGILILLSPLIWLGYKFVVSSVLVTIVQMGSGNSITIRTLIALGADVDMVDNNRTPLIYAIEQQNIEVAKTLISSGADVNFHQPDHGDTPLTAAAYYGQMPVVKLLISKGANINARDSSGQSVLTWAELGHKDEYGAEAAAFLKKLGAVK